MREASREVVVVVLFTVILSIAAIILRPDIYKSINTLKMFTVLNINYNQEKKHTHLLTLHDQVTYIKLYIEVIAKLLFVHDSYRHRQIIQPRFWEGSQ